MTPGGDWAKLIAGGLVMAAAVVLIAIAVVLGARDDGFDSPTVMSRLPDWVGQTSRSDVSPPVVEPTIFMNVAPETARRLNAAVPYATGPILAAAPFVYIGSAQNRAAARICLAGAIFYEAGPRPVDQFAVAQVVLNRLRHPAFVRTVCGVVFQGSERRTGCQFTFACDGALARRPSAAAWTRALGSADAALSGFVFTPVGTATHYHTDWVFPYWQGSLTKLVGIHSHIFYRWPGRWGAPAAFRAHVTGDEHVDPRLLAAVDGLERTDPPTPEPVETTSVADSVPTLSNAGEPVTRIPGFPAGLLRGNVVRIVDTDATTVVLRIDPQAYPGTFAVLANDICANKPRCLVAGFVEDAAIPRALPSPEALVQSADFVFRRLPGADSPTMLWNCAIFPRSKPTQCLER